MTLSIDFLDQLSTDIQTVIKEELSELCELSTEEITALTKAAIAVTRLMMKRMEGIS